MMPSWPIDVAVVELSDAVCQPSLFYHLGIRESFDMPHNVLLCPRTAMPAPRALQVSGDGAERNLGGVGGEGSVSRCCRRPSPPGARVGSSWCPKGGMGV